MYIINDNTIYNLQFTVHALLNVLLVISLFFDFVLLVPVT